MPALFRVLGAIAQWRNRGRSCCALNPFRPDEGNGPRRRASRPTIDAVVLEPRVLFSASPLVEMFAAQDVAEGQHDLGNDPDGATPPNHEKITQIFMPPLADGTASGAPSISLPDRVTLDEDSPSAPVLFNVHDPNTPAEQLTVVVTSSNPSLIKAENVSIYGDGPQRSLVITPEHNKFGGPVTLELAVSDGLHTTKDSFEVVIHPVNDRPEAVDLRNLRVTEGLRSSTIDLHAAFHDVDNTDAQLSFSVTNISNPHLFSRVVVDQQSGTLTLEYAPGKTGSSNITIRATDPHGAHVEIGPAFKPLKLYEAVSAATANDKPDLVGLGVEQITLLTQWALFDMKDGRYVYDHVNYDLLARALKQFAPADVPVVIDIEVEEYFGNTPEGRDNLGDVLRFAHEVRPDLEIGLYSLMPAGNWWTPMYQTRLQADLEAGLNTWYTQNAERFERDYAHWLAQNALYRTEPLASDPDGKTLAELAENISPSLYTPYRHFQTKTYESQSITIDPATDRITSDFAYTNGMSVVFSEYTADLLPHHTDGATRLYVVNATGNSFQLSTTPNGVGIDFQLSGVTTSKLARWMPLTSDIDVRDWHAYAEYNVEESRKYGDQPVYAWISPSIRGFGTEFLEGAYFRQQLEILAGLVDAVVIYEPAQHDRAFHENQPWWHELNDFLAKQNAPDTWLNVRVEKSNSTLIARDDSYMVQAQGTLVVGGSGLLANDSSTSNGMYWVQSVVGPAYGTLHWNQNGTFEYYHVDRDATTDQFRYTLVDDNGNTSQATVRIAIQNRYHAPSVAIAYASHQPAAVDPPSTGDGRWAAPASDSMAYVFETGQPREPSLPPPVRVDVPAPSAGWGTPSEDNQATGRWERAEVLVDQVGILTSYLRETSWLSTALRDAPHPAEAPPYLSINIDGEPARDVDVMASDIATGWPAGDRANPSEPAVRRSSPSEHTRVAAGEFDVSPAGNPGAFWHILNGAESEDNLPSTTPASTDVEQGVDLDIVYYFVAQATGPVPLEHGDAPDNKTGPAAEPSHDHDDGQRHEDRRRGPESLDSYTSPATTTGVSRAAPPRQSPRNR